MANLVDSSVNGDLRVTGTMFGTQAGNYATCATAGATAAKAVTISGFTLTTGIHVYVKFTVTNTAAVASLTLNVSGTGAKAMKYRGGNLPAVGTLSASRVYEFIYDGTNWELVGDLDTNTQTVTGVKGNAESSYRTGQVNLTAANIGASASDHTHGNIGNGGTLTDTAAAAAGNDYVVIRDADNNKVQTSTIKGTDVADAVSKKHSHSTLTLSTTAQAYDGTHTLALPSSDPYTSARTPTSHTHGNIANGGTLTDTAAAAAGNDYVVIRDADNSKIQTSTIKGTDVADAVSKKHSHSTLTLSTTAQAYDGSHTLALPSTDPYTSARTPTSHTHGNITNGGALQTNDITIANGDKLVVTDSSDSSKVARTSVSFDGSTTTTALTPKGTFEAFAKAGDITTAIQALDVSSVGGDGKYISAISETDGKISATATTMDTTPTASSTKAVTSGGIKTALDKKVDIANVNLDSQSTTILAQVQSLASGQIHYKRFYTSSDGGSANISDKPTGTTNGGFMLEAYCNRYVSASDWRYVVLCYVQATRPKIAWIKSGDTSISWQDLNTNTDTKVTQNLISTSGSYPVILKNSTTATDSPTSTVNYGASITANPGTGQLRATTYSVNGNCTLQYNSTDQALDFVF